MTWVIGVERAALRARRRQGRVEASARALALLSSARGRRAARARPLDSRSSTLALQLVRRAAGPRRAAPRLRQAGDAAPAAAAIGPPLAERTRARRRLQLVLLGLRRVACAPGARPSRCLVRSVAHREREGERWVLKRQRPGTQLSLAVRRSVREAASGSPGGHGLLDEDLSKATGSWMASSESCLRLSWIAGLVQAVDQARVAARRACGRRPLMRTGSTGARKSRFLLLAVAWWP